MAKEKNKSIKNFFIVVFLITTLLTSGVLIYGIFLYNGIESLIRYIVMITNLYSQLRV